MKNTSVGGGYEIPPAERQIVDRLITDGPTYTNFSGLITRPLVEVGPRQGSLGSAAPSRDLASLTSCKTQTYSSFNCINRSYIVRIEHVKKTATTVIIVPKPQTKPKDDYTQINVLNALIPFEYRQVLRKSEVIELFPETSADQLVRLIAGELVCIPKSGLIVAERYTTWIVVHNETCNH